MCFKILFKNINNNKIDKQTQLQTINESKNSLNKKLYIVKK